MPTFNRAGLLSRALESIFAQTFQDFEIIIVEDGSTDGTSELLANIRDNRVKIIRFEKNRGIGAARQAGVSRAVGEWVAFLDSDDCWHSEKLASDFSVLDRYPDIDILFDNYRNINYVENVDQSGFDQTHMAFLKLGITEIEPGVFRIDSGLADALLISNFIGTPSIITIRRKVFDTIGNYDPNLNGSDDFELLWRAAMAGICFAYQTRVLVERHKDHVSVSARVRSFIPQLLNAYDLCELTIRRYGQLDLLPALNQSRSHAWQSLIHANALEGRRWDAWVAYRNSLRYGFSREAVLYLLAALAGPHAIQLAKQFK